jgi:hypothetical protein
VDFKKDEKTLAQCIHRATSLPEIKEVVSEAGLSASFLEAKIGEQQDVVWEVLSSELAENERLLEQRRQQRTRRWNADNQVTGTTVGLVLLSIITLLAVTAKTLFYFEFSIVPAFLQSILGQSWGDYLSWAIVGAGVLGILRYFFRRRRLVGERNELAALVIQDGLDTKIETSSSRLWDRATTHALPPLIREIANEVIAPSAAIKVGNLNSDGLSEVFLSRYEISTFSKKELENKVSHMAGGSIGLAGPRGVGKTTLMKAYCNSEGVQINSREVVSVMLPAPVEYNAREFIIHLFSKFCRKILEQQGRLNAFSHDVVGPFKQEQNAGRKLSALSRVVSPLAIVLGALSITASFAIAYLKVLSSREGMDDMQQVAMDPVLEVIAAMGLNPAIYLNAGVFLLILAYAPVIRKIVLRFMGNKHPNSFSERSNTDAEGFVEGWYKNLVFQQRFTSGWSGSLSLPMGLAGSQKGDTTLARNPLSLPEIVDGFREVVDYTTQEKLKTSSIASQASLPLTVIIGIDELDKVHKTEHVRQFLNDVKALFNLENCFFLISISEDAMANFEMRGVPIRDVFDSSFDDVVYLKYLTSDDSARLLHRRVVGLPMPFLNFLFCFSGGLPRDLIRYCRGLLETASIKQEGRIDEICAHLLGVDVSSKLRILQGALVAEIDQKENSNLVVALEELEKLLALKGLRGAEVSGALKKVATTLLTWEPQVASKDQDPKDETIETSGLHYRSEFSAYFTFVAALYDVFVVDVSEARFERYALADVFEKLALAKQKLSDNPYQTIRLVNELSKELEKL